MSGASKQVNDRQKSAESVCASLRQSSEAIAQAVTARLQRHLRPTEQMPDIGQLITLMTRAIDDDAQALLAADRALQTERQEDTTARSARDLVLADAQASAADLIDAILVTFGADALASVLPSASPTDAKALSEWLSRAAASLRAYTWPPPRVRRVTFDAQGWADDLSDLAQSLSSSLSDLTEDLRQTESALSLRDTAQDTYDATFMDTARAAEALCDLGATPHLKTIGARLRPSARRPGQTSALADNLPDPQPADPDPTP
jgi:hypothetical protein